MTTRSIWPAVRAILALAVAMSAAGCDVVGGLLPSPIPTPAEDGRGRPPFGPVDTTLTRLDAFAILKHVEGGSLCRQVPPLGGGGGGDHYLSEQAFFCPGLPDNRDVWFLFTDAWELALQGAGVTTGTGGGETGGQADPLVVAWVLRGDNAVGSSRVTGVNTPGGLTIFVSLDLVIP